MSPLTALWIASVIGALLFYASGILSAPLLQKAFGWSGTTELAPSLYVPDEPAQSDQLLQAEVARVEALAHDSRREVESLRRQLDQQGAARAQLDGQLTEARAQAAEAARRSHEAQKVAASVPALRQRVQELEQAQNALPKKERAPDPVLHRQRALEQELLQTRGELEHLRSLAAARTQQQSLGLEQQIKQLEEEKLQRNLRVEMLNARVAELETYAEQNAALRSERDGLRQDLLHLQAEARALSPAPAATAPLEREVPDITTHARSNQSGTRRVHDEDTLESSLRKALAGLAAREPGLIAVLSDDNGFPVAGIGSDQQQESVSVLTSLTQELAERVKEFVDLDHIERMELADGMGRALRVRFFDWETQPIALGCLGRRSLTPNPDEELIVSSFPKLLRRAFSAGA
jgi:hypothetical protein